jgi:hypothetical protein
MDDIITQEDLQKLVIALQKKEKKQELSIDEQEEILKQCLNDYNQSTDFQIGDIVFWKENLKNRRIPNYNEPSIVMEVLKEPIADSSGDSGQSSFKELLNLKLGTLIKDGKEKRFITFYYDGNRFYKKNS